MILQGEWVAEGLGAVLAHVGLALGVMEHPMLFQTGVGPEALPASLANVFLWFVNEHVTHEIGSDIGGEGAALLWALVGLGETLVLVDPILVAVDSGSVLETLLADITFVHSRSVLQGYFLGCLF